MQLALSLEAVTKRVIKRWKLQQGQERKADSKQESSTASPLDWVPDQRRMMKRKRRRAMIHAPAVQCIKYQLPVSKRHGIIDFIMLRHCCFKIPEGMLNFVPVCPPAFGLSNHFTRQYQSLYSLKTQLLRLFMFQEITWVVT